MINCVQPPDSFIHSRNTNNSTYKTPEELMLSNEHGKPASCISSSVAAAEAEVEAAELQPVPLYSNLHFSCVSNTKPLSFESSLITNAFRDNPELSQSIAETFQADNGYMTQISNELQAFKDMSNSEMNQKPSTPITPEDREPIPMVSSKSSRTSGGRSSTSTSISSDSSGNSSNLQRSRTATAINSNWHKNHSTLIFEKVNTNTSLYPDSPLLSPSTEKGYNNDSGLLGTNSSRYLPQKQAIITTQDSCRITLLNQAASTVLSGPLQELNNNQQFIGKYILDFIDASHRSLLLDKIIKRRESMYHCFNKKGTVLICGDTVPIIKQDGSKSSASLWLKEKKSETGSIVFIWIFEELFQSTVQLTLDNKNELIKYIDKGSFELFGYKSSELISEPIQTVLPQMDDQHKFFGGLTKLEARFPVMITQFAPHQYRITSMPVLTGFATVSKNGIIHNCNNTAFSKYLFGIDIQLKNIATVIPQFPFLIQCLERDQLLEYGYTLNSAACREILSSNTFPRPEKTLPLQARHRDGTLFNIDLQIELEENNTDNYLVWITFDRESLFAQHGHVCSISAQQQKVFDQESLAHTTVTNVIRSKSVNLPMQYQNIPLAAKLDNVREDEQEGQGLLAETLDALSISSLAPSSEDTEECQQQQDTVLDPLTNISRPLLSARAMTEADKEKIVYATWPGVGEYAAQTRKFSIADFEIVDELGQGAFGIVKLAYLKSDHKKKHVVIKYIVKSCILVDCWTRDRTLGLVPVEVHILHTFRKIPHANCSDMLDYFEDDDNYYVIMDFYGASVDLFDYIELKKGSLSESEVRAIFYQVVDAVCHLHDNRIVHRDIKDENVIVDQHNGGVKLIDFGSAAYMKEGRKYETFAGTLDYAPPEILKGQPYTGPPQDIWACGILLYTLIYRENPFYGVDEILSHELRVPFVVSEDSIDLIRKMLDRDVNKRLTIHQVRAHSWFKGHNKVNNLYV